jgi:protease-4
MKKGILATILVIVILVLLVAFIAGFIYMQFTQEPFVPEHSFLKINLSGRVVDIDTSVFPQKLSIKDLWYHLKRAQIDNRIDGIILKISSLYTGFAKIEDIGRLIKNFKQSGKPVIAFIEGGSTRSYYLATFADKIYLFKGGHLFLKGLASEAIFLKKTLSLLGIQADLFRIGDYKTAANMFTKEEMTPPHKESLEKLLADIYQSTLEGIAANRNLDAAAIKKVFEESPFSKQAYLDAGLIDGILYEDEILSDRGENIKTVSFHIYRETSSPRPYGGYKKIAVIFASGEIHPGRSGGTSIFGSDIVGSDTVAWQLRKVRKNPAVKAVVLRLNSPGGDAVASDVIRREVELTAREKPLVISMGDVAASGGYLIAVSSSKVMALPQTITGSIGVLAGKFVFKGLYDKIGIGKEMVKTSQYADMFSDYRLFTPAERKKMESLTSELYREFTEVVAQSRGMKVEEVDRVARGRVWAGSSALDHKLIDQMGGLDEAIEEAKKLAQIPALERVGIHIYPREKSLIDRLRELISGGPATMRAAPLATIRARLELYKTFFPALILPYQLTID